SLCGFIEFTFSSLSGRQELPSGKPKRPSHEPPNQPFGRDCTIAGRREPANRLVGLGKGQYTGSGFQRGEEHQGMAEYRIGIDMGGTFTDAFMVGTDGATYVEKVDTRPADLLSTVRDIVDGLAAKAGLSGEELLPQVSRFMLGTTLT